MKFLCCPLSLQVYLATLQETPCAVKLLMGCDEAAAVRSGDSSLSLSMPVMQALQRVSGGSAVGIAVVCTACG